MWDALRRCVRRPLLAGLVLVVGYGALTLVVDPRGHLGTDTGAKVATLETMAQRDTFDPDVGYWAESLDPDGVLHPLYQAQPTEDGDWVAVTTLPMLLIARPLYEVGGYRATLLLPMLGAVGAAFAARALARRLGAGDGGWSAFWVVGAASPLVVYALDFWEHTVGVACMAGAVVLLVDVATGRGAAHAAGAGALLGVAAVLRNESFVYAAVAVGVVLAHRVLRERSTRAPVGLGVAAVVGFGVPWFANVALEAGVSAPARGARAVSTAAGFGDQLGQRAGEALQTSLGLSAGPLAASVVPGVAVVLVLVAALAATDRGDRRFATVSLAAVGLVLLADAAGGLGFVPGLFVAAPLAVVGVVRSTDLEAARLVRTIALLALPIAYLVQYTGGAGPQWGGRYTLTSSLLLTVVGVLAVQTDQGYLWRGLVVLSVGVTGLGVAWLGVRSHSSAEFFDQVLDRAEPVVISRNAFLLREGGAAVVGRRWLSVNDESAFIDAVGVARAVGEPGFSVLEWDGPAPPPASVPPDVREVRRWRLDFAGVPVGLVTYRFADEPG